MSDAALLEGAAGDPARVGEFYARYEAPILGYLLRHTGNPEVAADLAAETFADVVAQCRRGTRIREPRAWLYTLARGKLVDYQRRGRVADRARRRIGLERLAWTDDELDRVVAVASMADESRLSDAMGSLPPEQRAAVVARVVDGRDYADIAADQHASEAAIRQRVARGLARLRAALTKEKTS